MEGWSPSVIGVKDGRCGVSGGVSRGEVSISTSLAFKGACSGVGGDVLICLASGEDSKGEYGGVFTRGLRNGLSISAEAIWVRLNGTLD